MKKIEGVYEEPLTPNAKTLFGQLSDVERSAVATLIGFDRESAGYRNNLREIPALPVGFRLRDAVVAYAQFIESQFLKMEV